MSKKKRPTPLPSHLSRGVLAENLARHYLEDRGLKFLSRNFNTPYGEIDLILDDHGVRVFVEVKYRSSTSHGEPFEAVSPAKLHRLRKTIAIYCQQLDFRQGCRLDIVSISGSLNEPRITHYPNITI